MTREEKLEWLTRPFDYAAHAALTTLAICGLMRFNGVDAEMIMGMMFVNLGIVSGFLVWGMRRITAAAQGRASPAFSR